MDPLTIAALIGAASSAVQGIAGAFQNKQAKDLEGQYPRPDARMTPSIQKLKQYSFARTLDQDIAGGDFHRGEIKGATSAGIKAASEAGAGAEAYGMIGRLVSGQQSAFAQMGKMSAQQVQQARQSYEGVLAGPVAQEERRMDYWDREMPYLQAADAAQRLRMSGQMNMMSGVKNMAGMATAMVAPDLYSSLNSRGKSTTDGLSTEDFLKYQKWLNTHSNSVEAPINNPFERESFADMNGLNMGNMRSSIIPYIRK